MGAKSKSLLPSHTSLDLNHSQDMFIYIYMVALIKAELVEILESKTYLFGAVKANSVKPIVGPPYLKTLPSLTVV